MTPLFIVSLEPHQITPHSVFLAALVGRIYAHITITNSNSVLFSVHSWFIVISIRGTSVLTLRRVGFTSLMM
jgi:hypothetical protein